MNTVKALGTHGVALALLLFGVSFAAGETGSHDPKSGTSAASGPIATSCILAEDIVMAEGFTHGPDFPILWSHHLTGADLAGDFTRQQSGLVPVPYGTQEYGNRSFGFLPANRFNPLLKSNETYASSDESTEGILLAPSPAGTSASAVYQYSINAKPSKARQANGPRLKLLVGDSLYDDDVKEIGGGDFPYTPIRSKWQSDENVKKYAEHLLLLAELGHDGFPHAVEENESPPPVVYAPTYGHILRGNPGPKGYSVERESDLGKFYAASAVSNLMAITPEMPHAAITEWVKLTSYKENVAFVVQGIGTLNAYRLARVAARLKSACAGQDFVKCERRFRTDEKSRDKILSFEDEALEKFNESTLVLKNATASCDEKKIAFKKLREAVLLSPAKRKPREALANLYEAEKFPGAARYFRFGKDDEPYLADPSLANAWSQNHQVLARRFFRNSKSNLGPALAIGLLPQTDLKVRRGATQISSALPDREAVDYLNSLANQKDWMALEPIKDFVATESFHGSRESKKFPHYAVVAKRAVEDLRANGGHAHSLQNYYETLMQLILYGKFTLEQNRHLIDFMSEHALAGGTLEHRQTAVRVLLESGLRADNFEAKYIKRALLQVARKSTEAVVIHQVVRGLGTDPTEKKYLVTLVAERQEKVPELAKVTAQLLSEGWAK